MFIRNVGIPRHYNPQYLTADGLSRDVKPAFPEQDPQVSEQRKDRTIPAAPCTHAGMARGWGWHAPTFY
jgi:hypothetical protein